MDSTFAAPDPRRAAKAFAFRGTPVTAASYGHGHVNDTFIVEVDEGSARMLYILQRINGRIFANIPAVMENIGRVTRHIRTHLVARGERDVDRRTLTLVPTTDGRDYHVDGDGRFWRAYLFVDDARTYDLIETPKRAYQAARAFGEFTRLIDDLPVSLHDTIPSFHDTEQRFSALVSAIGVDPRNRAREAAPEIEFCMRHEKLARAINVLRTMLPVRIAHNDTKMNNVLIDDATDVGTCVVDLDTVMHGLSLYDYGDMIRSAAMPIAEDERDLSAAVVSEPMFEAVTRGYVEGMAGLLSNAECASFVLGAKVLTFESGLRFLTDFLRGDEYFRVQREGHNLDRTRTQLALLKSIQDHEESLTACVIRVTRNV
jgi:hypothetical protein